MYHPNKIRPIKIAILFSMVTSSATVFASSAQVLDYSVEKQAESDGTISTLVTISGNGFGEKSQPEPVLWVFGDDVRENGIATPKTTYNFGDHVGTTGPKIWEHVDANVVYDSQTRYPGLASSYFVAQDGTVRGPLAYGGISNPPYADEVYLSARIKPMTAWHGLSSPAYTDLSGNFDTGPSRYEAGESVTIHKDGNSYGGQIIHVNKDLQRVTILAEGMNQSAQHGAQVVGNSTGASMILDSNTHYSAASGSKYFRMWSGGLKGLYSVLSTNRLIVRYADSDGNTAAWARTETGEIDNGYGVPDMTSKLDWRLMEVVASQRGSTAYSYIDIDNESRRYVGNIDLSGVDKFMDRSPTISQLGLDAAGSTEMIDAALHFGEIYFDNTPQRIMLSQHTSYETSGSDLELQYPIAWSDNEVTFRLRAGELDLNKDVFVYIFDRDSQPNSEGFPLCISCALSAPRPIELNIE